MRTDDDGPNATHDGKSYQFCSASCKRAFADAPDDFAAHSPRVSDAGSSHDHH